MRNRIFISLSAALALFFIPWGCSKLENVDVKNPTISIHETENNFINDYKSLTNPRGIMPTTLDIGKGNPGIILKMPSNYFEYFAFDKDTSLILLSFYPYYYVKITSRVIASQLEAEYLQFLYNVRLEPADKKVATSPFFEKIGDCEMSVLFTPSQLFYSDDASSLNRIMDIDPANTADPATMLEKAQFVTMYTPLLEEPVLYGDLRNQKNAGKTRFVYTTNSTIFPPIYGELKNNLNFSFIVCSEQFSDSTRPPKNSDYDYCALFSIPLGNSVLRGDKDYLRIKHGITIVIKGNIQSFLDFFIKKGFDFENPPPLFNKLFLHENDANPSEVSLDWIVEGAYKIEYRRKNKNPETHPDHWFDADWLLVENSISGLAYSHPAVERGFHYYYRITDNATGGIAEANIVIAKDPVDPTIRDEDTGALNGEVSFSEVNLLGSIEESINSSGHVQRFNRPDTWIEICNISDRVLRLNKLDFYYHFSENPVILPSEIIFGPNCPSQTDTYRAVDTFLYPHEYHVISRNLNYLFGDMIIFNISRRNFPPLTAKNILLMRNGAVTLDSLDTDKNRGTISDTSCRSTVYGDHNGILMWILSYNKFVNINPNSAYSEFNKCSPGFRESGEF